MTTDATIPELLALLHRDPPPPWTVVGQVLLALDAAGYPATCEGPKSWMDKVLEPIGIKRASGWRYRAIARDWPWLRDKLSEEGVVAPPIADLDPAISAEQLEILVRLIKATAPEVWAVQARAVLERTTTLRELRRTWAHYRPVLRGKSARSRSSSGFAQKVHVDNTDMRTIEARYAAEVSRLLEALYPALLERLTGQRVMRMGFSILDRDEHFPALVADNGEAVPGWRLHAVALVKLHNHPGALVHGFVIATQPGPTDLYQVQASLVDALWYVGPEPHHMPPNVGLLVGKGDRFVHSQPLPREQLIQPSARDDRLLRWLLTKGLRRCYAADVKQAHQRLRAMPVNSSLERGDQR